MLRIREAGVGDGAVVFRLVRALAEYEKLSHMVTATAADLEHYLNAANAKVFALIAELDGRAVGMALYFYNFSTFRGRHGMYIEDIYVDPDARGEGIGGALLRALAEKAKAQECARMEWAVLDWNAPAIAFYEKLGAQRLQEWLGYRVEGAALDALATA